MSHLYKREIETLELAALIFTHSIDYNTYRDGWRYNREGKS